MYSKLKLRKLNNSHVNNQPIDPNIIKKLLHETAKECPFSTFPYVFGKNSIDSQNYNHSGNCVALSIYLQNKLKQQGIKSFLIPASIPNTYSYPEFLTISHVALAILADENNAFICDPAFYFTEPMQVNSSQFTSQQIDSRNIYSSSVEPLNYSLQHSPTGINLNQYQQIPHNTFFVETNKTESPSDKWKYHLAEVLNPDEAISSFFMSTKQFPFITCLDDDYNLQLHIKFTDIDNVIIKHHGQLVYQGKPNNIPDEIHSIIAPCLKKHLGDNYHKYFNLPKNTGKKIYKIKDKPAKKKKKHTRKSTKHSHHPV
jgi:hypothetical protein